MQRILIIDDEDDICMILSYSLRQVATKYSLRTPQRRHCQSLRQSTRNCCCLTS